MHPFSASDLLRILENGAGGMPAQQALTILKSAFPQATEARLASLTIGQRDACLVRLRQLTFGSQFKGRADCPICHERLELEFDAQDLLAPNAALSDPGAVELFNPESSFLLGAYTVTYRLLTGADLVALAKLADTTLASQQLLQACITSLQRNGEAIPVGDLPAEVSQALMEQMGEAEPLANLTLSATCPACGHAWPIIFDIVSYFWSEIKAWAIRLLHEVHVLASAYGWREADILEMSAWRRQRYLELIGL